MSESSERKFKWWMNPDKIGTHRRREKDTVRPPYNEKEDEYPVSGRVLIIQKSASPRISDGYNHSQDYSHQADIDDTTR